MTFVIGVDGGGTRTRAVILDGAGRELGRAEAPGAVATAEAPELAAGAVSYAVHSAAQRAGVVLPAASLWAGLAGAGAEAARQAVQDELAQARIASKVHVGSDVEAAFHDAFADGPGVVLIAGTGSIAWARAEDGRELRVGGWGRDLGDEGSGYAIGVEALRRVVRAEDLRDPPTSMRAPVLAACGVGDPTDLIGWIEVATKADVAALVPLVSDAVAGGDRAASEVFEGAVADLMEHVASVVAAAGPWREPPALVVWGGLVAEGGCLRERVLRALDEHEVALSTSEIDPPLGAARLALRALG